MKVRRSTLLFGDCDAPGFEIAGHLAKDAVAGFLEIGGDDFPCVGDGGIA